MDINKRLEDLIKKYNIDRQFYGWGEYIKARDYIQSFLKKNIIENNLILIGNSEYEVKYFRNHFGLYNSNIQIVNDGDTYESFQNLDEDCTYLVTSFQGHGDIFNKLSNSGKSVYDIYKELEEFGLRFNSPFFDIYRDVYIHIRTGVKTREIEHFSISYIFFKHRVEYENEVDIDKKRFALERVIFDLVYAKDFVLLKKYIYEYTNSFDDLYEGFWMEINGLLEEIQRALNKRNKRDCVTYWLDALEYGEDYSMPFLLSLDRSSFVFDNIYTVTPYTGPSFKTCFAKKRAIDEEGFKFSAINDENSSFMKELNKRDYTFKYFGHIDLYENNKSNKLFKQPAAITEMMWDILNEILLEKNVNKKFFMVVHEMGTHYPHLTMGLTGEKIEANHPWPGIPNNTALAISQREPSKKYIDSQLMFYNKLLPKNMYKIYMSDHGYTRMGRYHTIMKIQGDNVSPYRCEDMISLYDFDRIIMNMLDKNFIIKNIELKDFVQVCDVDYYNRDFILEKIKDYKTFSQEVLMGYQGVITKEDMLIKYNDEVILYQKHKNDHIMVTDGRMEYLESKLSKKRIDVNKEDKFKYSRLYINAYKKCKKRTEEVENRKWEIIRDIFANISSDSILAVRGGVDTIVLDF